MTEEIRTEISTDCSYYKDVVKNDIDKLDGMTKIKGKCGYEIIGGCSDLKRLEQENNSLQAQLNNITVQSNNAITALEQENKEFSFAIEKCLENAGIECDDEEQALRSLPMLGNSHYKVLVEKEALEQENKDLKKQIESDKGLITVGGKQQYQYLQKIDELEQENKELKIKLSSTKCYLCGEGFLTPEGAELYEEKNKYRSALEEIRDYLNTLSSIDSDFINTETYLRIRDKLNECLGE